MNSYNQPFFITITGRTMNKQCGDADNMLSKAHGFYWTATENDSRTAWFSNFGKNSQFLFHQNEGEKTDAFSVRCVKLKNTKNTTD